MGLLKNGITFINFDETYYVQQKLRNYPHEDIDLRHMKHVNLYCESESLHTIENQLQNRSQKGITFIGSGNYHYVTFLLLKEVTKPFTLVLFDNHPDMELHHDQSNNLLSCGSWVSFALKELPLLQRVVIIGPTTITANYTPHPRVVIFPFDGRHHYSLKSILSVIHTETIYISVDKDVLSPADVHTNWDQGVMNISTLTHFVGNVLKFKKALGMDICGEIRLSPASALLPEYQKMIRKNEQTNIQIMETCLKASHSHNRELKKRGILNII